MSSYQTDVMEHKMKVQIMLDKVSRRFLVLGRNHDKSKLKSPEKEIYSQYHEDLRSVEYGSPEYNRIRNAMDSAIQHHYAENDHHPEHFENGIYDMDLIQIIEMLADWVAVADDKGTNVIKDLPMLMERHNIPENYYAIFKNTIEALKRKG